VKDFKKINTNNTAQILSTILYKYCINIVDNINTIFVQYYTDKIRIIL